MSLESSNILKYILTGVLVATIVLGIMLFFQLSRLVIFDQYYTSFTTGFGPTYLRMLIEGGG